jgi:hypothetical protein
MATLELKIHESAQEQLRVWVAAWQIKSEQEFLAALVIAQVEHLAWLELGALLDEGLRAPKVVMRDADWDALLERVQISVSTRRAPNTTPPLPASDEPTPAATLEVELPDPILTQLQTWTTAGKIPSPQAFLTALITETIDHLAVADLRSMLDAGRRSGFKTMHPEDWDAMLARVRVRIESR